MEVFVKYSFRRKKIFILTYYTERNYPALSWILEIYFYIKIILQFYHVIHLGYYHFKDMKIFVKYSFRRQYIFILTYYTEWNYPALSWILEIYFYIKIILQFYHVIHLGYYLFKYMEIFVKYSFRGKNIFILTYYIERNYPALLWILEIYFYISIILQFYHVIHLGYYHFKDMEIFVKYSFRRQNIFILTYYTERNCPALLWILEIYSSYYNQLTILPCYPSGGLSF